MTEPIYGDCASWSPLPPVYPVIVCDFCGEAEALMIHSPRADVHICERCVRVCIGIVETE